MIQIEHLTKCYGKTIGVKDLSLEVKSGEIFGFIGPNGAGKSTTIKCLLNFLHKDEGVIKIDGETIGINDVMFKEKIGYLPSEIHLYEDLTVDKMLHYSASFYKRDLTKRIDELVHRFEIDIHKKIDELSFGNLKKVGIVIALMHEPKLLILDEPTNGLDPLMQEVFFEILKEEKKKGTTIFFSSHNLVEVKKVCDKVGIIKNGTLLEVDEVKKLSKNNFHIVTIESKGIKKVNLPLKDMTIQSMKENELVFIYRGDVNNLISVLSDISIEKLLIEEPTIEELFMHYYKED